MLELRFSNLSLLGLYSSSPAATGYSGIEKKPPTTSPRPVFFTSYGGGCSGVDKKPPVTSPSSGSNIQQIRARLLLLAAVPAARESVVVSATVAKNSRVGVVFSGRQSPGRHNVIWGLCSAMKVHNPGSVLLGFIGGTGGLFAERTLEIIDDVLMAYKKNKIKSKPQNKSTLQCRPARLLR